MGIDHIALEKGVRILRWKLFESLQKCLCIKSELKFVIGVLDNPVLYKESGERKNKNKKISNEKREKSRERAGNFN